MANSLFSQHKYTLSKIVFVFTNISLKKQKKIAVKDFKTEIIINFKTKIACNK